MDRRHREILAQCNVLADCAEDAGAEGERKFHEIFDQLMGLAREHFSAEAQLLAGAPPAVVEEQADEREEFEYLAAEIITTENFDKLELQRFLALWWIGHIVGSAGKHRAAMAGSPAA